MLFSSLVAVHCAGAATAELDGTASGAPAAGAPCGRGTRTPARGAFLLRDARRSERRAARWVIYQPHLQSDALQQHLSQVSVCQSCGAWRHEYTLGHGPLEKIQTHVDCSLPQHTMGMRGLEWRHGCRRRHSSRRSCRTSRCSPLPVLPSRNSIQEATRGLP